MTYNQEIETPQQNRELFRPLGKLDWLDDGRPRVCLPRPTHAHALESAVVGSCASNAVSQSFGNQAASQGCACGEHTDLLDAQIVLPLQERLGRAVTPRDGEDASKVSELLPLDMQVRLL
jgi:hypothetical protein